MSTHYVYTSSGPFPVNTVNDLELLRRNGSALEGVSVATLTGLIDHGGLAGLSDDDHTQYALLAGRTGGQSLYGDPGTGAASLDLFGNTAGLTTGLIRARDPFQIFVSLSLIGYHSPAQFTANQDDFAINAVTVLRASSDADRDLTGIVAAISYQTVCVFNVGTNPITLKNESASSTATNRFAIGADAKLYGGGGAIAVKDQTSGRWRWVIGLGVTGVTASSYGGIGGGAAITVDAFGRITAASTTSTDHGSIGGLTDDDHAQYPLLAGRSGGQTLTGGTAASNKLTLRGTSNATKGNVALNDTGGDVTVGGGTTASKFKLLEPSGSGTNFTAFVAQAQAGDVTYTLPAADGSSGDVLSTNGTGTMSWSTPSTVPVAASQAEEEAASSTTVYTSPGRQQYHPGTCKGWAAFDMTSAGFTNLASHNVASYTDNAAGDATVNWTTAFSSANYAVVGAVKRNAAGGNPLFLALAPVASNPATGSVRIITYTVTPAAADGTVCTVAAYGDQ